MRNPWKPTSFVLAGLLVASFGMNSAGADRQPVMQDALANLKQAQAALKNANHDKGGHRVKALELTNAAIVQVEKGIAFDNKH
jgi:hypothetical protein